MSPLLNHFPKRKNSHRQRRSLAGANKKVEIQTSKNMTTKMKRQGYTELPRFAVGALAIAGASAANGATVQISFANNVVSLSSGINNFVPDLTGDGSADAYGVVASTFVKIVQEPNVQLGIPNNLLGLAETSSGSVLLKRNVVGANAWAFATDRALVPFTFSDARINNSLVTSGFVDMEGFAAMGGGIASLKIHRLIFDDASTTAPTDVTVSTTGLSEYGATSAVPEASTSLGLLALGAGGILTRRRSQRAA